MASMLSDLMTQVRKDDWRAEVGFSPEIESANAALFKAGSVEDAIDGVRAWLQKYQPCLFGRIAAKLDLLSFCILTEVDLSRGDQAVCDKIQESRSEWTRQAFEGRKSGFVLLVISPTLSYAVPDQTLKQLALRLCSLYLLEDVEPDNICHDFVFLEKPGGRKTTWQWRAGVNVFAAAADGRWWQDHRIPGGIAFSVNSVGHMVKSGMLARQIYEMDRILGAPPESVIASRIDSLQEALEFAMRTIALASNAVSGKATELLPLPFDRSKLPVPKCPVELPRFLADKNYCEYSGYYHTDITVPSEYFSPDVGRPAKVTARKLDFTYLFDSGLENFSFRTMGSGRRVRGRDQTTVIGKTGRGRAASVRIASVPRLAKALGSRQG